MVDLIIIGIYLLITLGIGIYSGWRIKDMRDFAVADRNYATPILVATIAATVTGGESTIGITEKVFSLGIAYIILFFGKPISKLLIAQFIAPRMGRFQNMISVGDIMGSLYGKPGRLVTGFAGAILAVGAVGAQVSAIGYLFHYFLGMSHAWGILLGCGVVVFYSTFGGIRAVTTTDVIQFGVLIVAIPMVCNVGLNAVGGYKNLFDAIPVTHFNIVPVGESPVQYLALFIIFSVPFLDPADTQRLLMAKSTKQMARSMRIAALIEVPFYVIAGFIGLIALALKPDLDANVALPYLINTILPVGLKGFAIAGMLAVIMSSADSYLNVAGVTLVHDFIKPLRKKGFTDRGELQLTRFVTFILGALTIVAAMSCSSVIDLVIATLDVWGPTVLIPLFAGIFGLRANSRSFMISVIAGLLTLFLWPQFFGDFVGCGALVPAMAANGLALYGAHAWQQRGVTKEKKKAPVFVFKKKTHANVYSLKRIGGLLKYCVPSLKNMRLFSAKRVEVFGAQYILFGTFSLMNYLVPYFMWDFTGTNQDAVLFLRTVAGFLCFLLVIKDFWPNRLVKYLPLFWHMTLLFALPFLTTFMLIETQASMAWLLNMVLALFLLAMLVDWLSFTIILPLGLGMGWLVHWMIGGNAYFYIDSDTLFWAIYMYTFAILIGLLFSRNKERAENEKLKTLQTLGGIVAHEMRTPLVVLNSGASLMRQTVPALAQGYDLAAEAKLDVQNINIKAYQGAIELPQVQERVSRRALKTIDIMLMNLKEKPEGKEDYRICSIQACIREALEDYPFISEKDARLINWKESPDFEFIGNSQLMVHVLFNLLKNAIYYVKAAGKGDVSIWADSEPGYNMLCFKDTGTGMPHSKVSKIFDRFYTTSRNGAGVGLAFARMVMHSFEGEIQCQSEEGEYTLFILRFPVIEQ